MKLRLFLLCFAIAILPGISSAQVWTQQANFGGGIRNGAAGFAIGNKGYLGTGFDGTLHTDFWEYDPATNVWTQKASFGGAARISAAGFAVGGKGYIGLGAVAVSPFAFTTDLWEYDPAANNWTQKANFPGPPRYTPSSFVIGTKAYVGIGWDGSLYRDFWEYNPAANAWTQKANFGGTARQSAAAFALNGIGYVGTGHDGSNRNDFWAYDPVANSWTLKAPYPGAARYGAAGFALNGKGMLGTGGNGAVFYNTFYSYDDATNSWSPSTAFAGTPVRHSVSFAINGCGYVATGTNTSVTSQFWSLCAAVTCSTMADISGPTDACLQTSVAFTNSSIAATSILWNFGDGSTDTTNASTRSHVYTTAGTYEVTLVASSACGNDTDTISIVINPLPPLVVSNDTTICDGKSVSLSATGAATYQWSPASALDTTGGAVVTAHPTANTIYTVHAIDANGCQAEDFISVHVNPLAIADISGPSDICAFVAASFLNNSTNASSILWDFGNGLTDTNNVIGLSHRYAVGQYTVRLIATNGCGSDVDTLALNVHALPPLVTSNDTSICMGDSVVLRADGALFLHWEPAFGLDTTEGPVVTSTPAGNVIYTVQATDLNGCQSQDIIVINVQNRPPAAVSPAGPLTVCGGSFPVLHANATAAASYQWYLNGAPIAGATDSLLSVQAAGSYAVLEKSAANCPAMSNVVQVNAGSSAMQVVVTASPTVGCQPNTLYLGYGPTSVTLTAQAAGAVSYLWSTGQTTQSITVTAPGTYSVLVADSAGCISKTTPLSQVTIQVIDIRCGHDGKKIQFCHVPPGNHGNPQTLCIAPSAIASHLANHPEDCIGPCSASHRMGDPDASEQVVTVYPNPFAESFLLRQTSGGQIYVGIFDVTGRLVSSVSTSAEEITLGQDLAEGMYTLEVTGAVHEVYRIIKTR